MMEELVSRVLAARDIAHREHWRTQSYAAHMALGGFYDDVIDKIDGIVETHQGNGKLLGPFAVEVGKMPPDILKYLKTEQAWIEENRDEIAYECSALENLIDGLLETYKTTIYKLTFLK